MNVHLLLKQENEWISGKGEMSDVVISTRVRLARNNKEKPFPYKAMETQKREILDDFKTIVKKIPDLEKHLFFDMETLDELDRTFLLERHLVSKELIVPGPGKGVMINNNETVSVMVNEEDHYRMQVLLPGFALEKAWQQMNQLDETMGHKIMYAYSPRWGFLTACPTNVGTGLRASAMLHLPGLVMAKQINQVLQATIKLGLTFRGLYGEGSDVVGNIFQVSNQVTLGFTEEDIIDNLSKVISQIADHERNARRFLIKNQKKKIEDTIWRAYGLLANCRIISSKEAMELLSMLRMGINMDIINDISLETVNDMIVKIQPAHLQLLAQKALAPEERDESRAGMIRESIKNA